MPSRCFSQSGRALVAAAFTAVLCSAVRAQVSGETAAGAPPVQPPASAVNEQRPLGFPRSGSASRAPSRGGEGAISGAGTLRTVGSLAVVLGVAVAGAAAMRVIARRGVIGAAGRSPAGVLEVLGRYPVGRGSSLVLLKLDRRVLLVSQGTGGRLGSSAGMNTLCEVTDPDEVASILLKSRDADGDSLSERFRSLLSRFDRTMDSSVVDVPARGHAWDERPVAIPVVDLTTRSGDPASPGPVGALRRRLAAFVRPAGDRA